MKVRNAMFAGSWYPDNAAACEKEINTFIKKAQLKTVSDKALTGGIVPHAGWYFSGDIACNVINRLKQDPAPDVFVIFGMHLHPGSPRYIMAEGAWATPFGEIPIATGFAQELTQQFTFKIETADDFARDNTIELQLPFIKYFFNNTQIVPIGVPPAKDSLEVGRAVADIATRLGLRVKVLGSTDLTHYGMNYGFVPHGVGASAVEWVRNQNDKRMLDTMLSMDTGRVISEALESQNACCAGAAATAIEAAKQLGSTQAETIAYATSYDKSPGDSFVGYVGIVF
ncbi:AmmeMemoRadiSam system protein B [Thermodesulfobacteriota bacterium]